MSLETIFCLWFISELFIPRGEVDRDILGVQWRWPFVESDGSYASFSQKSSHIDTQKILQVISELSKLVNTNVLTPGILLHGQNNLHFILLTQWVLLFSKEKEEYQKLKTFLRIILFVVMPEISRGMLLWVFCCFNFREKVREKGWGRNRNIIYVKKKHRSVASGTLPD